MGDINAALSGPLSRSLIQTIIDAVKQSDQ